MEDFSSVSSWKDLMDLEVKSFGSGAGDGGENEEESG